MVLLVVACAVLAILQWRWTGELGRAETERLINSADDRVHQVAQTFDGELRRAVLDIMPAGEHVEHVGLERANAERLRLALAHMERPMFRRVAAAVPNRDRTLDLYEANFEQEHYQKSPWPEAKEWQALRDRLKGRLQGDHPRGPMVDTNSSLIEVPVFGATDELEWMIFELDTEYARKKWLPELIRNYINSEQEEVFATEVHWRGDKSRPVIGSASEQPDAEAVLFPIRVLGRDVQHGRWVITVTHQSGSIETAVQSARWRNLGVAIALLVLIAAASWMLIRFTADARRLAQAQFQFFAGVSHELRTPLTVIQGAGHNLLSGVVQDQAQRETYLKAIVKQSAQLSEMVDQVLSYSGLRQATSNSEVARASVQMAISEAVESAATELEQSGRSVDVDVPADLPAVKGDEAALRRALCNLIVNAIRHGGGEVDIAAKRDGSVVEVTVGDAGEGIAAEEIERIFEPFFRGEKARTGRVRGTGLGLSLVKETVESFGGTIDVKSKPGQGTVFTVRLKVA